MARVESMEYVVSHWHRPIENFQTSAKEFYDAVEAAIARREVPDRTTLRVDFTEAGFLTARREYLRVKRGPLYVDVCAAPFGTGYFFSSWLVRTPSAWLVGCVLGIVLVLAGAATFLTLELRQAVLVAPLAALAGLVALASALRQRFFSALTYYQLDTALMFQEAVHAAVLEVIDGLTQAKGLRALSEEERKPILRALAR